MNRIAAIIIIFVFALSHTASARLFDPSKVKTTGARPAAAKTTTQSVAQPANKGVAVNSWSEKKADKNGDGYLSQDELKKLYSDRYEAIKGKRSVAVEGEAEKKFDVNRNGTLDESEIKAMGAAAKK